MGTIQKEPVEVIFNRIALRWNALADKIACASQEIQDAIGIQTCQSLAPKLSASLNDLRHVISEISGAAKHPEVIIAMTGTTSSGKSTLANLLIGEAILPKAVQEMSAGVVSIQHHSDTRRLVIDATTGATWETGTWDNIDATTMQLKLEKAMYAYRKLVEDEVPHTDRQIDPPSFRITWPTRMGLYPAKFGLPSGTRLKLLDLPGLKYTHDNLNGEVLKQNSRKALCLVTYNSEETDPVKQEALLNQIVDQVKALQGSPARMLFVLNRIDAYRKDRDPEASERAFTERVTQQIRKRITEALCEYTEEARKIEPVPLSAEPALYVVQAQNANAEKRVALLRKISDEYTKIFPASQLDDLHRSPAKWTEDECRWFIHETLYQSRLENFEARLGSHIGDNLPELLMPELVTAAYQAARGSLEELHALVQAYSINEEQQANESIDRLEKLYQQLKLLQKEALALTDPIREVVRSSGDLWEELYDAVDRTEQALGLGNWLSPLRTCLQDAVNQPLVRLAEYSFQIMSGDAVEDPFIESVPNARMLREALGRLKASPYGRHWMAEGTFEGEEAKNVSQALTEMGLELSATASSLIARESVHQAERMRMALRECGEAIVNRIESEAEYFFEEAEYQGLRGVFRGDFDLQPPKLPMVRFEPNIRKWSRPETRMEENVEFVERRNWRTLWLTKKVIEIRTPVLRTYNKEGISMAKFADVLNAFMNSGSIVDIEGAYMNWLGDSLEKFDQSLEQRLKNGVKTYRQALEQRIDEIRRGVQLKAEHAGRFSRNIEQLMADTEQNRRWRENT